MGFAGALYALLNNFADPKGLHFSQSGDFVIMAVMGGMRSFWGPLLGAAVFVVLQDYLSSITVNWMSFVGLLFVLVVLFFPRGLLGLSGRRAKHEPPAKSKNASKNFGSLVAVSDVSLAVEAGRAARGHRPERRRQDHLLQPDQRLSSRRPRGSIMFDGRRHHRASGAPRASSSAWRAPSRSPRSFPS